MKEQESSTTPTVEEQIEYYDQWNLENRAVDFDDVDERVKARAERILSWLAKIQRNDLNILEIGCGTGWLTEKLAKFGSIVAIDLSPAAIAFASSRGINANFVSGDFMAYDLRGRKFDVIVCVETLFYVGDQEEFIGRAADHLVDQGWLAATSINRFVCERISNVGSAEKGQIRNWLYQHALKKLIATHFDVLSFYTILPEGDQGILRVVNSFRLKKLLSKLGWQSASVRIKERMGLGGGIVILARKR